MGFFNTEHAKFKISFFKYLTFFFHCKTGFKTSKGRVNVRYCWGKPFQQSLDSASKSPKLAALKTWTVFINAGLAFLHHFEQTLNMKRTKF